MIELVRAGRSPEPAAHARGFRVFENVRGKDHGRYGTSHARRSGLAIRPV